MDHLTYTVELVRHPGEKWGLRLNGSEEPGRNVVVSEIRQDGAAVRCVPARVCACPCLCMCLCIVLVCATLSTVAGPGHYGLVTAWSPSMALAWLGGA